MNIYGTHVYQKTARHSYTPYNIVSRVSHPVRGCMRSHCFFEAVPKSNGRSVKGPIAFKDDLPLHGRLAS